MPFDLPRGWAWARLDSLCHSIADGDHQAPPQEISGIPFLVISNVSNGVLDFSNTRFVGEDYYKSLQTTRIPSEGDILVTVTGSYGIIVRVDTDRHFCFQRHIALLKCCGNGSDYLFNALQSNIVKRYFDAIATGTAQKTVALNHLRNTLIPIPPAAEQKRIVAKIEELFAIADSLGVAVDGLENAAKRLDKKVLDLAIRGKLVPQDPSDEPASELVKRIAASHKSPCKNQSEPIDPPFDIPDSWEWVRLGKIISLLSGRDLAPQNYSSIPQTYPYMTGASNFSNGELLVNRWTNVPATISHNGDLLITCKGTVGVMAINTIGDIHIARQIMAISSSVVDLHYVKVFLSAIVSSLKATATSMIPGIDRSAMLNLLIPLPPLNEQKRIVKRVEELKATTRTLVTF